MPPAAAQVARPHLTSKGNLSVPTGNPSPIRVGDTRLYGYVLGFDSDVEYAGGTDSEFSGDSYGIAADFRLRRGSASGGYAQSGSEQTFANSTLKYENTTRELTGQFAHRFGADLLLAVTGAVIEWETQVSLAGLSGTAGNRYVDFVLGARYRLSDRWRIGGFISPEVSSSDTLGGDFTSANAEFTAGHGLTVEAGVGWRVLDPLALEGSVRHVQESEDAGEQEQTALTASAGWAITELIVLEGALTRTEYEQLDEGGAPAAAPGEATTGTVGAFFNFDPASDLVVGLQAQRHSETASDTGNPDFDESRFDSQEATAIQISLSGNF